MAAVSDTAPFGDAALFDDMAVLVASQTRRGEASLRASVDLDWRIN